MKSEKRLIDANELTEKLRNHHDFFVYGCGGFRYLTPKDKARVDEITNCIAEITNAPTVDAVVLPCRKGDVLIRDGQKCVADHWNILLTAFNEEKQVRLFDLDEVEAALAKMDGERRCE